MELDCGSFVIRRFRPEDAPSVAKISNNPNVAIHLRDGFPHPYSLEHARAHIEATTKDDPPRQFAMARGDEVVGSLALFVQDDVHRLSAELGYFVGEPYWGQGIASRAVAAIVPWGFENLDLVRIYAYVFDRNPASIRVLEKCGFQREGTLRRALVKAGRVLDMELFARLQE